MGVCGGGGSSALLTATLRPADGRVVVEREVIEGACLGLTLDCNLPVSVIMGILNPSYLVGRALLLI